MGYEKSIGPIWLGRFSITRTKTVGPHVQLRMHALELIDEQSVGFSHHALQLPHFVAIALRPFALRAVEAERRVRTRTRSRGSKGIRTRVTDHRSQAKLIRSTCNEISPA